MVLLFFAVIILIDALIFLSLICISHIMSVAEFKGYLHFFLFKPPVEFPFLFFLDIKSFSFLSLEDICTLGVLTVCSDVMKRLPFRKYHKQCGKVTNK